MSKMTQSKPLKLIQKQKLIFAISAMIIPFSIFLGYLWVLTVQLTQIYLVLWAATAVSYVAIRLNAWLKNPNDF